MAPTLQHAPAWLFHHPKEHKLRAAIFRMGGTALHPVAAERLRRPDVETRLRHFLHQACGGPPVQWFPGAPGTEATPNRAWKDVQPSQTSACRS